MWEWDLRLDHAWWSAECRELMGLPDSATEGRFADLAARVHPADVERFRSCVHAAARGEPPTECDFRVVRPGGEVRWLNHRGVVIGTDAGRADRIVGIIADVTDQRDAAAALRDSEAKYRRVIDSIRDALVVVDMSGRIREANAAFRELVGYTDQELSALTYVDLTPAAWHEMEARIVAEQILATGRSGLYEKEYRHKDGHVFPVELRAYLMADQTGTPIGMSAIVRDITVRKHAEQALDTARMRLEAALEASQVVLFHQDRELRYTWIHNPVLGYAANEVIGKRDRDLFERGEDAAQTEAIKREVLTTGTAVRREVRIVHGGVTHYFDLVVQPDLDAKGAAIGVTCAALDVTARRHAEEARRLAGQSFQQLVERSPFGVYAVDADFRLVMVSAGAQKVFQNVRPLLGRDFEEVLRLIWPEPFVSEALGHFRHTLATGEPYHAPRTVEQRADIGATESYDWKIERMVLPDGRPGAVCHFYDLSERQQHEAALRASEHRYRTLLEATSATTWTSPASGWHVVEQPTWMAFTGQTAAEMLGHGWMQAVHPDDIPAVTARWRDAAERDGVFESEHRLRRRDGVWRWVRATGAPVRDETGRALEYFGAIIDITERRTAEEDLRRADRQKDQFVAILAHELRNPLAPIRTAVALLKTRDLADPVLVRSRDVVDRQVAHMSRLLDDLLDVSRLSRGTLTLQRSSVALRDVIAAAIETAAPLVEQRSQSLSIAGLHDDIVVDGDHARLVQVFGNLLTNAAKYSPAQAAIGIVVGRAAGDVTVTVRDNGVGIAREHLQSIFDLFSQVDEGREATGGGLGIGLALVKWLVELHGGSIAATSDGPGRGSAFTVRLPAAPAAAAPGPVPDQATPARQGLGLRVLVADDNEDAADMSAALLLALGCDVRTAYRGETAFQAAADFLPDVMLLDLGLPDIDGREVCRRIRAQAWGAGMMLIALTGWGRHADREATTEAGFDHHLVKPADPDELVVLLNSRRPVR